MTGGGGAGSVVVGGVVVGAVVVEVSNEGCTGGGPSLLLGLELGSGLALVLTEALEPTVGLVLFETTGTGTATPFGRIVMPGAGVLEVGTGPSRVVPSVRCSTGWDGAPGLPDT
jgi:hypothetical protein